MTCSHGPAYTCGECRPDLFHPDSDVARQYTIDFLAERIRLAKNAYYAGSPIMTDEEFDALEGSLRAYAPNHPVLSAVGSSDV